MSATLLRAPTARTFSIADLVEHVRNGRVRIPTFQRSFRWTPDDIVNLFDSTYRGYPIGSLLFWKRDAPHAVITLGNLKIEAEATGEALWVVDGQQRLTSLAAVLLSVGDIEDPGFSVFFDLANKRFVRKAKSSPSHWLPMNRVVDTRALLRWLGELQRSGVTDEWVETAMDLSKRIREYQIPVYIVETDDEATLRTIFDRLNTSGKSLKSSEVFQALHGGRRGEQPEDLRTLAKQVASLGFGTVDENSLLRAVLALRGPDVYRDFRNEFGEDEDPTETFRAAGAAIERMIGFLRTEAEIAHVRVLPYRFVIPVLTRYFHLHPVPSQRSLTLLRRWIWRDALAAGRVSTSVPSVLRQAVRSVDAEEHESVQRLLRMAPASEPDDTDDPLSARLNEARARANVALMASWAPRSLVDGQLIDLADHFGQSVTPLPMVTSNPAWRGSLVNRMVHPATAATLEELLKDSPLRRTDPLSFTEVLESHAIPPHALEALERGESETFLEFRNHSLRRQLEETATRLAEWGATDRPPLSELIVSDAHG